MEGVFFAVAIVAIGGFVGIRAFGVAEVMAIGIGPEGRVDDLNVFLGDEFWVIAVVFVKAFFEGIVHGVNGGLAVFVALEGVEVGFLDEKENKK